MKKIELFYEGVDVGFISFEEDKFKLTYSDDWIKTGFEISPVLKFDSELKSLSIKYFLENLLPEGQALEDLTLYYKISKNNILGLTRLIGEDTTGAIKFSKGSSETSFREVTEKELAVRLDERNTSSIIIWDKKIRLSAAGVQDKLNISILNNTMGFGEGEIASTHILKFQKLNNKFKHLVLNEYFCMTLAKEIGFDVCNVEFKRIGEHPVLFVERFDREIINTNKVNRFHIVDGCQSLDLSKSYKYEKNFGSAKDVDHIRDGVSFNKLFDFALKTKVPAITISKILNWMVYNLAVSNFDAHGKNISFFISKSGIELTPFYDIVNLSSYNLDDEFAMGIDGEFKFDEIKAFQLSQLCEENSINKKLLKKIMKKQLTEIDKVIDKIILPRLGKDEDDFMQTIKDSIKSNITELNKVWPDIDKV